MASSFDVSLVNRGGPALDAIQNGRNTCLIPVCVGVHVFVYMCVNVSVLQNSLKSELTLAYLR